MSGRGSSNPAIFEKMSALGAFLSRARSAQTRAGKAEVQPIPDPAGTAGMRARAQSVSINHLPSPSELPAPGLEKTG
jgi:hypothetical protein